MFSDRLAARKESRRPVHETGENPRIRLPTGRSPVRSAGRSWPTQLALDNRNQSANPATRITMWNHYFSSGNPN